MQITVDIPDEMLPSLESYKEDLPKILALGLRKINANPKGGISGLADVLEFLAMLPSPEEILSLRLSSQVQDEINALLEENRHQGLNEKCNSLQKRSLSEVEGSISMLFIKDLEKMVR